MSPAHIYLYTTWRHWCLQLIYTLISRGTLRNYRGSSVTH